MSDWQKDIDQDGSSRRPSDNPPAFNVPGMVLLLGTMMIAVHAAITWLANDETYFWVLEVFAFVPITMTMPPSHLIEPLARFWSPFTHAFLHGDWTHLIVNLIWLMAFGSAVAKRLGAARFLIFMALASAAGAGAHYVFHMASNIPVIGASGAVSGCMGAAARFAFVPGRPVEQAATGPALSLIASLQNRGVMTFVVIWFGLNWLFGAGIIPMPGVEGSIAWEAHMGGFLFGLLAFSSFDPVPRAASI